MEILLSILSQSDQSEREVQRAVGDGLAIGRGAEDGILLEGENLSREHFILTHDDASISATDLSVNGTWVNGKRLKKSVKTRVCPGDSIEVPGYVLRYRLVEEVPGPIPAELRESLPSFAPSRPSEQKPVSPKQGPLSVLKPVSVLLSSFTAIEKIMLLVAITGLLLLYTYATS